MILNLDALKTRRWLKTIKAFTIFLALIWTLVLGLSLSWNLFEQKRVLREDAMIMGRTSFQKDVLYRAWNAGHGGVYVPVTAATKPNPYLNDDPKQNIQTQSGEVFTLINPAYMTRQVFELQHDYTGIVGHITSLKPIRPENAPDVWEEEALLAFEQGLQEYSSIEQINGQPYLRFMQPLIVESRCLKCHARQGYEEGQVRGGISESVPLLPLQESARPFNRSLLAGHIVVWMAGIAGILYFTTHLKASLQRQAATEEKLMEMSTHDSLTGLRNRGFFEETLKQIDLVKKNPVSILSADVDDLKKTNDNLGHEAGDQLLKRAAEVLTSVFRDADTVARVGGDEFVIVLPNTNDEQAQVIVERVREQIEKHNQSHTGQPLGISIGIATCEENHSLAEILRLADQHMYKDKATHKKNQD
jgi:diguanylate cyclase (GGDEF)-like protein